MKWLQRMREHKARIGKHEPAQADERARDDWKRGDDHLWDAMMHTNNPVFVQLWQEHQKNKPGE